MKEPHEVVEERIVARLAAAKSAGLDVVPDPEEGLVPVVACPVHRGYMATKVPPVLRDGHRCYLCCKLYEQRHGHAPASPPPPTGGMACRVCESTDVHFSDGGCWHCNTCGNSGCGIE